MEVRLACEYLERTVYSNLNGAGARTTARAIDSPLLLPMYLISYGDKYRQG